jgi:hypothetical protein
MKRLFTLLYLLLIVAFSACRSEYENELELRAGSSGVIKAQTAEQGIAKRGERITVYTKVGATNADVKIFIGNVEAPILTHGQQTMEVLLSLFADTKGKVLADTFGVVVPETADFGNTNIYITVNGNKSIPFPFLIKKPDILVAGQVTVAPLYPTPFQTPDGSGVDGAPGTATISAVIDMGLDKAGNIYFIDHGRYKYFPEFNRWERQTDCIRKISNGVITTLGGNGEDEYATNLADLKLRSINAMKIADDGTIYISVTNLTTDMVQYPWDESWQLEMTAYHNRILKIDPLTGKVETFVGKKKWACWDLWTTNLVLDGPADKAMIGTVRNMELDKEGNLYILDDGTYYSSSILRKVSPDGTVTTVAGKLEDEGDYVVYDFNGKDFETLHGGTRPAGNSADGFGKKAVFDYVSGIALAGNGKLYMSQGAGRVMKDCIREFNPLTKEVSTIIGKPANANAGFVFSGTFKEVDTRAITSLDADFDGNVLIGYDENYNAAEPRSVYKMDVTKEMVYKISGRYKGNDDANLPQPGNSAQMGVISRIVFDQFGKLYVGYSNHEYIYNHIHFATITLDRTK